MRSLLSKEFCLWLVSPSEGTVRKIRLSAGKVLAGALLTVFFLATFMFVASDYTRVQVLRAKHYFNFKRLTNERGNLVSHNHDLRTKVKNLEQETVRVLNYEEEVRQRLAELSTILQSAGELGLPVEGQQGNQEASALGGAELDCKGSDCNKEAIKDANPKYQPSSWLDTGERKNLLYALEKSISISKHLPIAMPVLGFVNSPFGPRKSPFSGRIRQHQGVDFALPYGSEVYATGDGVVKSVTRTRTYGLKIDIAHGAKIFTRFAHLSKATVKKGDAVCRGQSIGLVGSSGRSTGPHLHYEVRLNGKAVDPARFFSIYDRLKEIA